MQRRTLQGGRLAAAAYDERARTLQIDFRDGTARVFSAVPHEVWQRLVAAPNPAAYYEDRIADEYPWKPGSAGAADGARRAADALFAPPPSDTDTP